MKKGGSRYNFRRKNNLALIRKFAYNLLRFAIIREHPDWGMQRMIDHFCADHGMISKYVFEMADSFYSYFSKA